MGTPKESFSSTPSERNSILIAEVRKFPSLYDTSDPNYYVLAERNKAWLQVAENCNQPAEYCHLRWKSLRKRFAKEKRKFPEILQGQRKPWALFPKMSFLTPATSKGRIRPVLKSRKKSDPNRLTSVVAENFKPIASDDDMLIVNDNDEIVTSCKSVDMSEEDEYIYETLDDPDSALEFMKTKPQPEMKPTAIRSGGSANMPIARRTGSGRIRKLTPKMQNSLIAKKLKNAQQILQQYNVPNIFNVNKKKLVSHQTLVNTNRASTANRQTPEKAVLYQDKTTRHVATVNPNIIRVEKVADKNGQSSSSNIQNISKNTSLSTGIKNEPEPSPSEDNKPFKVVKLKGRNPIIFSPEQLPQIKSFLKSESAASPRKEQNDIKSPTIKVKSIDNLNNSPLLGDNPENNLDIIHSVGLMRKDAVEKPKTNNTQKNRPGEKESNQSYSRTYSWNKPGVKTMTKSTTTEKPRGDSQTNDYEIEETWNDIKEENIDDDYDYDWSVPNVEPQDYREPISRRNTDPQSRENAWNKLSEAKLELVAFQRKLIEEQHKKTMEFLKKEHDLKMTLLKAEIDLKRKQLNIML